MTIEEYKLLIEQQHEIRRATDKEIDRLKDALVAEHAPVKPGWIIEDRKIRILVKRVTCWGDYWEAWGSVLNKDNNLSRRHTGNHSIVVYNLNGPKNTVKIISRGNK